MNENDKLCWYENCSRTLDSIKIDLIYMYHSKAVSAQSMANFSYFLYDVAKKIHTELGALEEVNTQNG